MPLILIESPNKISKLKKILGANYTIMASVGHIMDLSKKNLGIDEQTFEATYKVNSDKKDVVKAIKAEAKKHDTIYIATDPDREGEAIAFHLASILPKTGVTIHRVKFNAITKEAVTKAMKSPGKLDEHLYNAQQARRITDRLVGFKVSPIMWTKGLRQTSAGRVQSVALKIISDREKEINSFKPEEYWTIEVHTDKGFSADFFALDGENFVPSNKAEADKILADMNKGKKDLVVSEYKTRSRDRAPYPPFVTSTLQQAASNSFGWSAKKTMDVAQSLFSQGAISYHRTDSTRIDPAKITDVRKKIEKKYGKNYLSPKPINYGPKGDAQDAHEAIRPTYDNPTQAFSRDEKRLLELIDSRFVASQMASAKFDQVSLKLEYQGDQTYGFKKNGSTLVFDGFLKVYGEMKEDVILPALSNGDLIPWNKVDGKQNFTKPPNRYSDASLIKLLEKEGVGRPSTYASILDTLTNRKYVERKKKSLSATDIGIIVADYLSANFSNIIDTHFTSNMESDLDEVASGKKDYKEILTSFNDILIAEVKAANQAPLPPSLTVKHDCPKCSSKKMIKKISKYGPFLACATWPKCDGTLSIDGSDSTKASVETGHTCPKCSNILVKRKGKAGEFYGCKAYPVCKYSAGIGEDGSPVENQKPKAKDTGHTCPKCKKGTMLERMGKYGKFYGCSAYPKCKNIMKKLE
jgi:DNA topoisomerase-1